jgi:hypothetical protein
MSVGQLKSKKIEIALGEDLQHEYESWLACKESLGIERSINSFLNYIYHYGTFQYPQLPE